MTYYDHDGTKRVEYRPPEEAFNAESLASLLGKPITVGHKAMVNAGNAAQVQPIGTVLTGGRQDGNDIVADVVIYDLPTSARELSCGYQLDLDETPGTTPDGKHYDAIQRNIRYNHVAVVPRGRAGVARLNMDGDQIDDDQIDDDEGGTQNMSMTKVRTDSGIEYDAAPEVKVYVEKLLQERKDEKAAADKLQAKYDAVLSDLEKEKKAHKNDIDKKDAELADAVKARVDMLQVAQKHGIERADSLSDKEIKIAIIHSVRGDSFSLDGKSDEYINAAFDMAKDEQTSHPDAMKNQRQQVMSGADRSHNEDEYDLEAIMAQIRKDEAVAFGDKGE
nr:MAG TPA: protein of unknown function (DUF2213) [Caudoviricetes sp.]